jgi:hypothetical protein
MVPLHDVQLNDIHYDLEGNDDQLEEYVVDEIVDFDAVVASYLGLLIK